MGGACCRKGSSNKIEPFDSHPPESAKAWSIPNGGAWSFPPPEDVQDKQGLLISLATELAKQKSTDLIAQMLPDAARSVLHASHVWLVLREKEENKVMLVRHGSKSLKETTPLPPPEADAGPLRQVWRTGETLNLSSKGGDGQALKEALGGGFEYKALLCMAIWDERGEVIGIVQAVRQFPFDSTDESMLELLVSIASQKIAINSFVRGFTGRRAKAKMQSLLSVVTDVLKVSRHQDLKRLVSTILHQAKVMFECDRCTLYAVDHLNNDFIGFQVTGTEAGSVSLEEARFPYEGIVADVMKTGFLANVKDAWEDARFTKSLDVETGYRTKTLLVSPLVTSTGKTVAVLQCVNKIGNDYFSQDDELELQTVSALVADNIQRVLLDNNFASIFSTSDVDTDVQDMMRDMGNAQFSHHLGPAFGRVSTRKAGHAGVDPPLAVQKMENWFFDHWSSLGSYDASGAYVGACLGHLGLSDEFAIQKSSLQTFVSLLKMRYVPSAVYHNWGHAFSTFHICFGLLSHGALGEVLPDLDRLGMLLGALGHDVEHPGVTNQYLINKSDMLAMRYNDMSVLENHHASVTCTLLKDEFEDAPFLKSDSCRLRKVIVEAILGTDMAKHHETVSWLESSQVDAPGLRVRDEDVDAETSMKLCIALLHAADLAHPTLQWQVHQRLSVLLAQEFFAQFNDEQRLGLPSVPFMGKDPSKLAGLAPTQVGFIRFVANPLWHALDSAVVGGALPADVLDNVKKNQDQWQSISDSASDGEP